jgi:hypothetical protein
MERQLLLQHWQSAARAGDNQTAYSFSSALLPLIEERGMFVIVTETKS